MGTDVDVLQVITTPARRGAERFACALQPELEARGLSVRTVALVEGDSSNRLDVDSLGPTRLAPSTIRSLRARSRSASVVVAHGSTTLPASALATLATSTPFVYRNIGDPRHWSTGRVRRLRTRLLLSRAAGVIALTPAAALSVADEWAVPPSSITAIPNAVPAQEFPRRNDETRRAARAKYGVADELRLAVYLGALSPEKDVSNAIEAIAALPDRWTLLIAGEGQDRERLDAESRGVRGDRVRLVGQVSNPAELLAAADLLVLPSRTEGLPGVVVEAGMVGVPAVATDVGYVKELIDDGVTGRLVPPDDSAALAAAIMSSEPDLGRLGEAARERAMTSFSLETVADQWYDLLHGFVTGEPRRAVA